MRGDHPQQSGEAFPATQFGHWCEVQARLQGACVSVSTLLISPSRGTSGVSEEDGEIDVTKGENFLSSLASDRQPGDTGWSVGVINAKQVPCSPVLGSGGHLEAGRFRLLCLP